MLDLISHMICHMTALVVITTAVFKGGTSLAPLSEKKNEQTLKIYNRSSLCSLQSTGLSKNCSANRFVCSQVLKRVKRLSGKKSLKSSTGPKSAVSTITLVLLRNGESSFDLNRYRKPRLPKQVVYPWRRTSRRSRHGVFSSHIHRFIRNLTMVTRTQWLALF